MLEVSAGTGRNVAYYPSAVQSVVFTDVSYGMLRKAKLKWEKVPRAYDAVFVLSDAQHLTEVWTLIGSSPVLLVCPCCVWN